MRGEGWWRGGGGGGGGGEKEMESEEGGWSVRGRGREGRKGGREVAF